ncbi:hypothetical protein LTR36_009621 [Oleoguttula mirabilis]|uniref:Diphthamide biosynthesis protein 4 n=1 Tax=Oleoguttula mirabilis TaxID=1507867 RepID=A0AAV9J5S6_9PEZI|nr:hypothetical protein LTR36_009621 [Oleoguttula mirabilis]
MPSHYELLGLESWPNDDTLSAQDIKHAYKRALLLHHPDKVAGALPQAKPSKPTVTVDEIAQAYKTLSDPHLRTEYDRVAARSDPDQRNGSTGTVQRTGLETVDLDSLAFDEQTESWSRSCRCGDTKGFVVTESELEKYVGDGELTVGCKGCSLWLKVLFSVEE